MLIPRVSVVMTTYNGERFLSGAIESVLNQSFTDLELIVVDDGSTDSSAPIIRSFCARDSRIQGIFLNRNAGIPKAANCGLCTARGEYVARMDSDDLCHPGRLAKQVAYLDRYPEIFVLGCRSVDIDERDKKIHNNMENTPFPCGRLLIARLITEGAYPILHPTLMVRKFCYKELKGYREIFSIGEDEDLYFRLLRRYGAIFENLPEPLHHYRRYKKSTSRKQPLYLRVKIQILVIYSAFCCAQGINDPLAKIEKLDFHDLPLSNAVKERLENIIFLVSFSSAFCQENKELHLASIVRAEKLLSILSCILQGLPYELFIRVKRSQPFIRLARAWLRHGYWLKGIKCIALAFMKDPFASLDFFFKRSVFHGSSFARKLFRAHS